ncbi:MAG: hypothetical protein WDM70_07320 [Nitrosomonadales bacterium]
MNNKTATPSQAQPSTRQTADQAVPVAGGVVRITSQRLFAEEMKSRLTTTVPSIGSNRLHWGN